jgi:hypothetical protein
MVLFAQSLPILVKQKIFALKSDFPYPQTAAPLTIAFDKVYSLGKLLEA